LFRQQLLDLRLPDALAYGHWVRHAGVSEAQDRLALWLIYGGNLWIGSSEVAGKTHLLRSLAEEHRHLGLISVAAEAQVPAMVQVRRWLGRLQGKPWWLLDVAAGPLNTVTGLALFHLIERAREMHRPLAVAWRCPREELAPPELASRLKAMPYQSMRPPQSDHELRAVILSAAGARQWRIEPAVVDVLLTRLPRRLSTLLAALDCLEAWSLAERRRPNVAWVRGKLPQLQQRLAGAG